MKGGYDFDEALYGRRSDVSRSIAIGTKALVHMPKKKIKKIDSRNFEGIMVGYAGSNQYRIWIPGTNKIRVSRDVRFMGEARNLLGTVGAHRNGGAKGNAGGHAGAKAKEKGEQKLCTT